MRLNNAENMKRYVFNNRKNFKECHSVKLIERIWAAYNIDPLVLT